MSRRATLIAILLAAGVFFTVHGAFSQTDTAPKRRAINPPGRTVQAPFSAAIAYGNTLYISGNMDSIPRPAKHRKKLKTKSSCCSIATRLRLPRKT